MLGSDEIKSEKSMSLVPFNLMQYLSVSFLTISVRSLSLNPSGSNTYCKVRRVMALCEVNIAKRPDFLPKQGSSQPAGLA
jgi:hypothetical protein